MWVDVVSNIMHIGRITNEGWMEASSRYGVDIESRALWKRLAAYVWTTHVYDAPLKRHAKTFLPIFTSTRSASKALALAAKAA